MKAKEDPELERKIGEWIEDITGLQLENTSDLHKSLKSGVVLCMYVGHDRRKLYSPVAVNRCMF